MTSTVPVPRFNCRHRHDSGAGSTFGKSGFSLNRQRGLNAIFLPWFHTAVLVVTISSTVVTGKLSRKNFNINSLSILYLGLEGSILSCPRMELTNCSSGTGCNARVQPPGGASLGMIIAINPSTVTEAAMAAIKIRILSIAKWAKSTPFANEGDGLEQTQ